MNFFRQQIAGNPFSGETISGVFPYQFNTGTTISGWDNITSVENIHTFGFNTDKDYKYVRDQIKDQFTNPWSSYTINERLIFCEHKIGSHDDRVSTVGLDNVVLQGLQYHSRASKSRTTRFAYGVAELHNRLPDNAPTIIDEARNQIVDYIFFGREGVVQGDMEGITDYLNSLGSWSGTGLSSKAWVPDGMTLPQLIDRVEDIILNGNY